MGDERLNLRQIWQAGYERLLAEGRAGGHVRILADSDERREHPRFQVTSEDVSSNLDTPVNVLDMSITGVAFEAEHGYFTGRPVALSLASVFATDAEVLACERIDGAPEGRERYRVRCRFRNIGHGLQFLTLTLELDRIAKI